MSELVQSAKLVRGVLDLGLYTMATGCLVLVADDERSITDFLSDVLTEEGYTVLVVHDGASALLAMRSRALALVILDVTMPVMTGAEVLHALRAEGYTTVPVVLVTAGLDPDRFFAEGATAILPKPFALDQLLTTVQRYAPLA